MGKNKRKDQVVSDENQQQNTTLTPPAVGGDAGAAPGNNDQGTGDQGDQKEDAGSDNTGAEKSQEQTNREDADSASGRVDNGDGTFTVTRNGVTAKEDKDGNLLPHVADPEPTPVVDVPAAKVGVNAIPADAYQLPLSASPSAQMTIKELKEYVDRVSGRRLSDDLGGQAQATLYHILMQIVTMKAEDFDAVMTTALQIIRDNLTGAFSGTKVHRYTPHTPLPAVQVASLRYLVNVFVALADPGTRQQAKQQINVEQALSDRRIKEDAKQRFLAYFNF